MTNERMTEKFTDVERNKKWKKQNQVKTKKKARNKIRLQLEFDTRKSFERSQNEFKVK